MSTDFTAVRTMRQRWLKSFVFGLDDRLRKHNSVYEYSLHPDCFFRIQRDRAGRNFRFSDGTLLKPSDHVITLHVWNEHMPPMPEEGPTIDWARHIRRSVDLSFKLLAAHIESRPEYDRVRAIKGEMAMGTEEKIPNMARIAMHYGFESARCDGKALPLTERLHRIGENILGLMFVLATNPVAARLNVLRRGRALVYLPRDTLLRRYGKGRRP